MARQIYRMTARALLLVRRRHVSLCIENPYAACIICKTPSITVRAVGVIRRSASPPLDRQYNCRALLYICRLALLPFRRDGDFERCNAGDLSALRTTKTELERRRESTVRVAEYLDSRREIGNIRGISSHIWIPERGERDTGSQKRNMFASCPVEDRSEFRYPVNWHRRSSSVLTTRQ